MVSESLESSTRLHHVVVVGGGFAGLNAVRGLAGADVRITLIDRNNYHLFQPLLYQVATGGLSPANISAALRALLARQANVEVMLAEVLGVDVPGKRVLLEGGGAVSYDTLLVACGAVNHYFGAEGWDSLAPGLKTIEDALTIRGRIFRAFEAAEWTDDPAERDRLLTFVVVGAGPTGVELAGALGEMTRYTLRRDFRRIDTARSRLVLLEGGDRVLSAFAPALSAAAARHLAALGVETHTRALVTAIDGPTITYRDAESATRSIRAGMVLWTAGVAAAPLTDELARAAGIERDRAGRVPVLSDLTLPGHPDVFVLGDMARVEDAHGVPLPGIAPVAMQEGQYAARVVIDRTRGRETGPFRYRDKGIMATIGRAAAVADVFGIRFHGLLAWLAWLFIHLLYLVRFENRLLVLTQWAWSYLTWNRSARLITGR